MGQQPLSGQTPSDSFRLRARCIGRPEIDGVVIKAPERISWNVGEPHGFVALEAGATLVNIIKNVRT